jgi:hypothetical protein
MPSSGNALGSPGRYTRNALPCVGPGAPGLATLKSSATDLPRHVDTSELVAAFFV